MLFALMAVAAGSYADEWTYDKPHTSVAFTVRHLVISNINGNFDQFDGKIVFDGKNWDAASAEMTVQTASVDTDNEDRDKHLRAPDFFDAEKYPTLAFKSTSVIKGEGNKFKLVGNLTIKDVTKEVTFDCEFHGTTEFMGTTKAGFSAEAKIDRQDFNVSWNSVLDTGGVAVGNEVHIKLEIEANRVG
jgi:polyisoprenoid-binding protein YceI